MYNILQSLFSAHVVQTYFILELIVTAVMNKINQTNAVRAQGKANVRVTQVSGRAGCWLIRSVGEAFLE